jgi:hypothetical protein
MRQQIGVSGTGKNDFEQIERSGSDAALEPTFNERQGLRSARQGRGIGSILLGAERVNSSEIRGRS